MAQLLNNKSPECWALALPNAFHIFFFKKKCNFW